jgi:hypothetical protein
MEVFIGTFIETFSAAPRWAGLATHDQSNGHAIFWLSRVAIK